MDRITEMPAPGLRDRLNVEGKHNILTVIISQQGHKNKEEIDMSEARVLEEDLNVFEEIAVLDDASAEIVLRQLKDAEDQYDRMKSWYDQQIQKLKDIRDLTRTWAETCLRPYMEMVPATGKKIRTYEMPGGTMKLAKQDPEYKVEDAELVPWLKKNKLEKFVEVREEAKWGDFKETLKDDKKKVRTIAAEDGTLQVVTADGEIIPGIKAIPREDKFTVKVK